MLELWFALPERELHLEGEVAHCFLRLGCKKRTTTLLLFVEKVSKKCDITMH